MSQIDIQDLFDKTRFPSGWRLACTFLYTPIGLLLALLRLFIILQLWVAATLLPDCNTLRTFLRRGFSFAFGIVVKTPKDQDKDKQARIIIANSVSVLDHFPLYKATQALTPTVWELPFALSNALGLQLMDMTTKEILAFNINQFVTMSNYKVALQPEFGITNSRVALLKFETWPFAIEESVQPIAISAWRPEFIPVRLTSLSSRWWSDVFWFMFVPYTIFTFKYLKIKRNADCEALVREVERDIATSLNLEVTSHTISDKVELEKRYSMEKMQSRRYNRSTQNSQLLHSIEVQRMVRQVSEVLPLVPHSVILKDLLKTRNVDVTIANILDGIVTYTPNSSQAATPSASSNQSQYNIGKSNGKVGSSSFQERKIKMILKARERYIQKHGLKSC